MNILIVGGGQVGSYLAGMLIKDGNKVTVIEERPKQLALLNNELKGATILSGGFTDPVVLEKAGIAKANVVVAVTAKDEDNLVVSTLAKFEFGVVRVIARVNNPKNSWLFTREMGVDIGLNQADLMAHIVVEEMDLTNMLTLLKMKHGNYSIVQFKVDNQSEAVGKSIKDLAIPVKAVLIALYRGKEVIIPRGNTIIESGDDILAFADGDSQAVLNKLFGYKE
jgi:trk system potassium uptake protein TrkA